LITLFIPGEGGVEMAKEMTPKEFIARRIALELKDGDVVNLGIGLPTMVANYMPPGVNLILESENGFLGIGPAPEEIPPIDTPRVVNAGGTAVTILPFGSTFDCSTSFALMRGGHLDACVLGGLQVDEEANLANWTVPGKSLPAMGGAMDLVVGTKKVIIAMIHTNKGNKKILHKCTLPLTAEHCVSIVVTEKALFRYPNGKLTLEEYAPGVTVDEIKSLTEADFAVSPNLKEMVISQVGL
jgi:acetate CoA/acetoacetate CoA-transferase beta subunit